MGKNRDYWTVVGRRALREALEHSKLHKVSVTLFTLAPSIIAGVGAWMKTGEPTWTTVFTLTTLAAMTCLGALFRLATVPPKLAEEARLERSALEAKLATFDTAEEDAGIMEGVAYIAYREWDRGHEAAMAGLEVVCGILNDIEKRALKGRVRVWGCSQPTAHHTSIPAEYWERQSIDLESLFGQGATPRTTKNGSRVHERYHHPMINRAEFEREWPKLA